ncbi:hypothetical protein EON77_05230, partial [bacterium]
MPPSSPSSSRRARPHELALAAVLATAMGVAVAGVACGGDPAPTAAAPPGPPFPDAPAAPLHCDADPAKNPSGSGHFGCWFTDEAGLPAYEYTVAEGSPRAATFTKRDGEGGSTDQYHAIGNLRIKAMVHADGRVRVFDPTRGPKWVSDYSEFEVKARGRAFPKRAYRRIFGAGYGAFVADDGGLRVTRTVFAPMGEHEDTPALVVEYALANTGRDAVDVEVRELWDAEVHPVDIDITHALRPDGVDARRAASMASFLQTPRYDAARRAVVVTTEPVDTTTRPPRAEASRVDAYPGALALALAPGPG